MAEANSDLLSAGQQARLALYLARHWSAGAVMIHNVSLLSGGAIQQNLAITLEIDSGDKAGTHECVLRMDAPSEVAASLSRLEEYKVLSVAHVLGLTVPEPMLACDDATILGQPFVMMHRVSGVAMGHKLVRLTVFDERPDELVTELGKQLARLHQVTPDDERAEALSFLPIPKHSAKQQRIQLYRGYLDALSHDNAPDALAFEWGLRWLENQMPESGPICLIHGDFRTGNYMVDPSSGRLTAILDWEFAAWSDPMEDLGWLMAACWRFGRDEREVGGIGTRDALFNAYNQEAEHLGLAHRVNVERVAYWQVMALIRWGIIARQQGERSAKERRLELALTSLMAPEAAHQMIRAIKALEEAR